VSALRGTIFGLWAVFWIYWLASAAGAKKGTRPPRTRPPGLFIVVVGFVLLRIFRTDSLTVDSTVLQVAGAVLFLAGLALAVGARIYLGRNWGMPMTQKEEPELVTSGPYHFVRHPIYSGILLAVLGTSLATNLYWLIAFLVMGTYFVYSASTEERFLMSSFPSTYPSYKANTKMLIPFVF
jgi:protein-S-isoprenylcysteine O-methyltransferase Ste14